MTREKGSSRFYQSSMNHDENSADTWLVPYCNMMTILMIFFLMLYAFTKINKSKAVRITETIQESIMENKELKEDIERLGLVGEFRQFIWQNHLKKFIEVSTNSKRILIAMSGNVLFDIGSVSLRPEGKKVLSEIAKLIDSEAGDVLISGHTDNTPVRSGIVKDNWELSGKRAYQVLNYLIEEGNVLPIRLSLAGFGEYAPVVSNDTEENREFNRRIEISIIKKKKLWTE